MVSSNRDVVRERWNHDSVLKSCPRHHRKPKNKLQSADIREDENRSTDLFVFVEYSKISTNSFRIPKLSALRTFGSVSPDVAKGGLGFDSEVLVRQHRPFLPPLVLDCEGLRVIIEESSCRVRSSRLCCPSSWRGRLCILG